MKIIPNHKYKIVFFIFLFLSCSGTSQKDDPLKNTKALMKRGHVSLYNNGALQVKGTSIKFIPPFKDGEISFGRKNFWKRKEFALSAFSSSVKKAAESVIVIKEGEKLSYKVSKKISDKSGDISSKINQSLTLPGKYIMYKSTANSIGIWGNSFRHGVEEHSRVIEDSKKMKETLFAMAEDLEKQKTNRPGLSEKYKKEKEEIMEGFRENNKEIVTGYVELGSNLKSTGSSFSQGIQDISMIENMKKSNQTREKGSESLAFDLKEVFFNYGAGTKAEFQNAKNEFKQVSSGTGLTLATLKSLVYITKGIFYDGAIKPFGQLTINSIGYVGLNTIVFPVAIVTDAGVASIRVVSEVVVAGAKGTIYVVAPSTKYALASVIGSAKYLSNLSKSKVHSGKGTIKKIINKTTSKTLYGAGFVTEKSGEYLIAPLSMAGVIAEDGLVGGGILLGGNTAGLALTAAGGGTSVLTYGSGKVAAGTAYTTGLAASAATGIGYGVYQLTKAVGIPSGVVLGSGVIMSYEMASQLSAQTILSVADFSYLVLSLEGGKWVVYAVKDTSQKAKYLLTGSVVDIDKVREKGGKVVKVPVEEDKIDKIFEEAEKRNKKK
ncbi:MAG: hypothetical protein H7A23_08110 [Leptospiraceae bacterium]|nr:hypothetical protein [Leptospiraceae bacterium]